jgi:hypothetical protein
VDDIVALRPSVLFVQNSVARYAQEYLTARKICVFANVKPRAMRILARVCQTPLFPTVPSKANSTTITLGSCESIHLESYEIPPVTKPSNCVPSGNIIKDSKTCCVVDGCPKDLFATLVLRGKSWALNQEIPII